MPRVSRFPINKETATTIQQYFFDLIASLNRQDDIQNFLNDFLTPEEKTMLAKRLVLYIMLKQGYSSLSIQHALNLTRETVRIHKGLYESKSNRFHTILDTLIGKEKSRELWKKLEAILKPLDLVMSAKTDMKARAKIATGVWD